MSCAEELCLGQSSYSSDLRYEQKIQSPRTLFKVLKCRPTVLNFQCSFCPCVGIWTTCTCALRASRISLAQLWPSVSRRLESTGVTGQNIPRREYTRV